MFGHKKDPSADRLTVQVHAIASSTAFSMVQKIWKENERTMRIDQGTNKEFEHFAYANPRCTVWLQRDQNRTSLYELIVRWENEKTHEVYVIANAVSSPIGDDTRAKAILNSMLITPSIVLSNN